MCYISSLIVVSRVAKLNGCTLTMVELFVKYHRGYWDRYPDYPPLYHSMDPPNMIYQFILSSGLYLSLTRHLLALSTSHFKNQNHFILYMRRQYTASRWLLLLSYFKLFHDKTFQIKSLDFYIIHCMINNNRYWLQEIY